MTPTAPVHGGLDLAELRSLGLDPADVLDLSASINPLGPPHGVREAIAGVDPAAYPERDSGRLRERLALLHEVARGRVLVGNGSTELLHLVARALLGPDRTAAVLTPAFGEYAHAVELASAAVVPIPARPDLTWDTAEVIDRIRILRPELVFLALPASPSGIALAQGAIHDIARAVRPGWLVLDLAYLELTEQEFDEASLLREGNVLVVRSLTKDLALAGLRLGYLLGPGEEVTASIARFQPAWSVSAVAQAAGMAALEVRGPHLARSRIAVRRWREELTSDLDLLGLRAVPSTANYLSVEVGDAPRIRQALLRRGVAVRDCTSFGLPSHIRVAVRGPAERRRFVDALISAHRDG